jgi:hypothetical protein
MLDSQSYEPNGHPEFLFGREQDLTLRLHIILILKKYVRKIISKSPSRRLSRLQEKFIYLFIYIARF